MWYYCMDCGHVFEDGEESSYTETLAYTDGKPYRESFSFCPMCGVNYADAKECLRCSCHFAPDKMIGRFCRDCLEDLMTPENVRLFMADEDTKEQFAEFMEEVIEGD